MNITKENIDKLNAIIKIDITEKDYREKIDSILQGYRKKANIPGFRKGQVPMGMIKKQYSKSVMADEINKLLQDTLNKYLTDEKLDVLGNPLPKHQDNFSWDNTDFTFEFELGLAPKFEIDLKKKAITYYKITADKKTLEKQVINIQERYGKMKMIDAVIKTANITGIFVNEEKGIDKKATFKFEKIEGKKQQKELLGKKVGDVVTLKTKGLFTDNYFTQNILGISPDIQDLDIEITFTIGEITETELAALNQDLFDKIFGKDEVKSKKDMIAKLNEDAEKQFEKQADQQLLNDVTESLIENTKFDLPAVFLQKWMATTSENPITPEQAKEQYEQAEKGLRYQLIEGKISKDNNLQITFEELNNYTKTFIKGQMAQYGNENPSEEELNDIVNRVLSNKEEVKRLQDQLVSSKLLTFYKKNVKLKEKKITFSKFTKEIYK
ncbi:MAG: trigger factor [Flavobacteriaceae bacterium]|nr:trigger factor [Flavobacteriaceae bacterium]